MLSFNQSKQEEIFVSEREVRMIRVNVARWSLCSLDDFCDCALGESNSRLDSIT